MAKVGGAIGYRGAVEFFNRLTLKTGLVTVSNLLRCK
jgi:hypothetical protein